MSTSAAQICSSPKEQHHVCPKERLDFAATCLSCLSPAMTVQFFNFFYFSVGLLESEQKFTEFFYYVSFLVSSRLMRQLLQAFVVPFLDCRRPRSFALRMSLKFMYYQSRVSIIAWVCH